MKRNRGIALWAGVGMLCWAGVGTAQVTFKDDVEFLKTHNKDLVLLTDKSGQAQVAVAPQYQGKVMTSTAAGAAGVSFGWINRETIASGQKQAHINVFGGEDRFWLGPEGGQFSIFFKKGDPFDFEHWQTPEAIDWGPWQVVDKESDSVSFRKDMQLANCSGTAFSLRVDRQIELLSPKAIGKVLDLDLGGKVKAVAFSSTNTITNTGKEAWEKKGGLLSIWMLGMFNPGPQTTVVIPYLRGPAEKLGAVCNDMYFGKVPAERLVDKDGVLYFRADGQYRSKIGISPLRVKDVAGSYDAQNGVLTIVRYTLPKYVFDYVNSTWQIQEKPFAGDVVNSYNDGPVAPGAKPLGPFYEIETSSPAAALKPGKSLTHVHTTIHMQGAEADLNVVALSVFGVDLATIKGVFAGK